MKAPPGAAVPLFAALVLTALVCPQEGASQERPSPYWRTIFVNRHTEAFRVGNQAAGSQNCIGWACRGALLGEPVHDAGPGLPSAGSIFAQAFRHSKDLNTNIGVEHGAMALREMQVIEDYRMLHSSAAIWEWLHERGPVAAAIYWDELLSAQRGSLRSVSVNEGSARGERAHAITILGWSPSRNAFYFTPNLGRQWGGKGFAFIKEEDLQLVLIGAAGFIHQGADWLLSSVGRSSDPLPESPSDTDNASPADARHLLLEEALSRVEAVSRSRRRPETGAATTRR